MKIKIAAFLTLVLWVCGGLFFYVSYIENNRGAQTKGNTATPISTSSVELVSNDEPANQLRLDSTQAASIKIDTLANSLADRERSIKPKTINTGFNLTDFIPDSEFESYSEEVVRFLAENSEKVLHIYGHTDSVGDDEVNVFISSQRANTLKSYFLEMGVNESQLLTVAKGEKEPVDDNSTLEGRRNNRRIELIIE